MHCVIYFVVEVIWIGAFSTESDSLNAKWIFASFGLYHVPPSLSTVFQRQPKDLQSPYKCTITREKNESTNVTKHSANIRSLKNYPCCKIGWLAS